MPARPLTSEIGATENVLRALLSKTLAGTAVAGYERWVYLNVRDTYADGDVVDRVAAVLQVPTGTARELGTALSAAGLLDRQGALTRDGEAALVAARQRVGAVTARLLDGIAATDLATAATVLQTVRIRAETQLDV